MRTVILAAGLAGLSVTGLAGTASAAPLEAGEWSGAFTAGIERPVNGDVHGGAVAAVPNLGPLNPALAGVSAELRIVSRSYEDIYEDATTYGLELTRGIGGNREVFGALRRVEADEGSVQVGGAFVPALSTTLPVFGRFGEYKATNFEAGLRQYFGEGAFKPYVAGRAGLARVDGINATFTIPAANIAIPNARFYDDSTVAILGADVGVSYALTDRFSLAAETGLRWHSSLKDDDSSIAGLGLASINDEGDRLSVPVSVRATVKF